jgi:pimeloyl-ACP methyl ester carboxylesterase
MHHAADITTNAVPGHQIALRRIAGRAGKPALVFLHEGLGCIGMWRDFPDALCAATGCPGLVYDRPGHGGSSAVTGPRGPAFFEVEADGVLPALLAACSIDDAILVGHSDGGTIALLHAARYPVRALVLEAAHVFVEGVCLDGVDAARRAWRETDFPQRLARHHGGNTEAMFFAWADMWAADWFRDWNIETELPGVTCPVLAIQGAADEYGTPAQLAAIARGVTGPVETMLVPDSGHSPHIQARDAVLARMAGFIAALPA